MITADTKQPIKVFFSKYYRGHSKVNEAIWHSSDVTAACTHNILRYDADSLAEVCDFLLSNAYLTYGNTVYRQTKGIPMGLPTSPQFANAYAGIYEIKGVIKLSKTWQQEHNAADRSAMLQAAWKWSRCIDDIAVYGWPTADQARQVLTHNIYPPSVRDADGKPVDNPMQLNLERSGTDVHYLDMNIHIGRNGTVNTTVYCKRDHLPTLRNYRPFPHIDSLISTAAKYNVYTAALHRFAKICSTPNGFSNNATKLMQKMVQLGYRYERLRTKLYNFRAKYEWLQMQVFHAHRHNVSRGIWRRLMHNCNRKIRVMQKQSRMLRTQA